MRKHRSLMVVGTASGVGKSATVTALCRIFQKDGYHVCPFKSQNMALNSYVTKDGKEMGRAQAVQAEAIGLEPQAWMNPILLKPSNDKKIQVIIEGKSFGNLTGPEYHKYKQNFIPRLQEIYHRIEKHYDISVIEGAGSPAEINMLEEDISNFGMARIADAPVLLVADIDKGGVFASIYGTIMLLEEKDRRRIKGIIINKFRGNVEVLKPGLEKIETLTGVPVLGVMPYSDFDLEEEDSLSEKYKKKNSKKISIRIGVVQLRHLSNMTDFDALRRLEEVDLHFISKVEEIEGEDIIILPGSKNTIEDYLEIEKKGIVRKLREEVKKGTMIIGICGGFQMLGSRIEDPYEIESEAGSVEACGFLEMNTILEKDKNLLQYQGSFQFGKDCLEKMNGISVKGYEIHQGVSMSEMRDAMREDRIISLAKGRVWGSYLHGIFDNTEFLNRLLEEFRQKKNLEGSLQDYQEYREEQWEKLEQLYRKHLDISRIYKIMDEFEKGQEKK